MAQPDPVSVIGEPAGLSAGSDLHAEMNALRERLAAAHREAQAARAELETARSRERALAYELQHRVRNMLSVIQVIYRRTRDIGASQEEFAEHFQGRLDAISRYHSRVGLLGEDSVDLEDIVRDELLETRRLDAPGCALTGVTIRLRGKTAELMMLAVHELATNSIKFGALSTGGKLAVGWSVEEDAARRSLHFSWVESGISPLAPAPRPSGFGRHLIEEALPYEIDAMTTFDLSPGAFECRITLAASGWTSVEPNNEEVGADDTPLLRSEENAP